MSSEQLAALSAAFRYIDSEAGRINGCPNEPRHDILAPDDIALNLSDAFGVYFDEDWPDRLSEALTAPTRDGEVGRLLAEFGKHQNWELSHYSPMRCDDDDQSEEWRVHAVNGGINDREWTQIGAGETVADALRAALAAQANAEQ